MSSERRGSARQAGVGPSKRGREAECSDCEAAVPDSRRKSRRVSVLRGAVHLPACSPPRLALSAQTASGEGGQGEAPDAASACSSSCDSLHTPCDDLQCACCATGPLDQADEALAQRRAQQLLNACRREAMAGATWACQPEHRFNRGFFITHGSSVGIDVEGFVDRLLALLQAPSAPQRSAAATSAASTTRWSRRLAILAMARNRALRGPSGKW